MRLRRELYCPDSPELGLLSFDWPSLVALVLAVPLLLLAGLGGSLALTGSVALFSSRLAAPNELPPYFF